MLRIILTFIITWLYCVAWMWLEKTIEGQITNSTVDNVIMVLFIPIIYMATDVIVK